MGAQLIIIYLDMSMSSGFMAGDFGLGVWALRFGSQEKEGLS